MKKCSGFTLLFALLMFAAVPQARAQTSVGVNGGYNVDDEAFFAGGQLRFGTLSLPVVVNPSVETYFDDGTHLQFDLNALYLIGDAYTTTFTPYAGAGLGVAYYDDAFGDSTTDPGLNLVAGANFGESRLRPFVEARIFSEGWTVSVRGGFLFTL